MNKYQQKHIVSLTEQERVRLEVITRKGTKNVRIVKRARALLKSARGKTDADIAREVEISERTVQNIRKRYAGKGGIDSALYDAPRTGQPKKLDEKADTYLIALACSAAPKGRDHWTLEILQKQMIADGKAKNISLVALWNRLKKRGIKPWLEKNVVCSESHA